MPPLWMRYNMTEIRKVKRVGRVNQIRLIVNFHNSSENNTGLSRTFLRIFQFISGQSLSRVRLFATP